MNQPVNMRNKTTWQEEKALKIDWKRLALYLLGLLILAAGLTLTTKVSLGVSPIISVSFCISQLWNLNLGDVTFVWYCVLVVIQIVIHLIRRKKSMILQDFLQIAVSLIFTRLMNLYGAWIPVFAGKEGFLGTLWWRLLMMVCAIVLTGVGAAMSVDMRIIPNPGDGIAQTTADVAGIGLGTAKNVTDLICVLLAGMIALLKAGRIVGIGPGTLLAVLGVGRVIALFHAVTGLNRWYAGEDKKAGLVS